MTLFKELNSGLVQSFYGRVSKTESARGERFAGLTQVSVAVETGEPKGDAQYNPSLFITANTDNEDVQQGDKVIITGLLQSRKADNGKVYYSLNPFARPLVEVVESRGSQAPAASTKKTSAPAGNNDEDDF